MNEPSHLLLVRSDAGDGGWSIHAPGTTLDGIREGEGLLLSGTATWDAERDAWSAPTPADYIAAMAKMT